MKENPGSKYDRYLEQIKRLYFAGIPVADIATALGMTHGSLWQYIRSRGLVAERQRYYVGLINEAMREVRSA